MRRFWASILALICVFSLVACNSNDNSESSDSDEYYFTAKVIESSQASLLVEVTDVGNSSLSVGTPATLSAKGEFEIGDTVKIVFDGVVQETYPCQLPNVYSVSKTEK